MIQIHEIKNKIIWDGFFIERQEKTFLQSWSWGEFQKQIGNKIWRLGISSGDNLIGIILVSKVSAKRGTFLLVQHGPVIINLGANDTKKILKAILEKLSELGKQEGASFIRIAPLFQNNEQNRELFHELGFKLSPMHANAYEATWKLNLLPDKEEILKNMRKTTRYLIRQAQNNSAVSIETSQDIASIEKYQYLNNKVAKRQKFVPFSEKYIKNEFEVFAKDNQVLFFFGKYKEEIVCASLVIFWSNIAFYHQAASDTKYRKLSIPYLLQWEAILEAKKRGCVLYDFWGFVDPQKYPKHPWAGPTLFKMGFGGEAHEYLKAQDFPLTWLYNVVFVIEKLRSLKRFGA